MRYALLAALIVGQCGPVDAPAPQAEVSDTSVQVDISGYAGDIMEPFLSRDGATLFFNNRNDPPDKTDLYWAQRIDDLHFRYRGPLAGANSAALDGVPSMSADNTLCYVSTRSYAQTLATIYCGKWTGRDATNVTLQTRAAPLIPGRVVFDFEISPGGDYATLADGKFTGGPVPAAADLRLARRDGEFRLDPASDALFDKVNTKALEYAAGLSADGLTLCFTRLDGNSPSLWIAKRATDQSAFDAPRHLSAITGFVEACTFAPDGAIYFHRLTNGRYTLWRAVIG